MEYSYIDIVTPQGPLSIPFLPLIILRKGERRGEKCLTEIDTGFDKSLLLDHETYRKLGLSLHLAVDTRELSSVGAVLGCLIFEIEVVVENRWFDIEACFPTGVKLDRGRPYRYTGNPIIGMKLLNELDIELDGLGRRLFLKR